MLIEKIFQRIEDAVISRYFSPINLINRRATIEATNFIEKNMGNALLLRKTIKLREFIVHNVRDIEGDCLEFGVYKGDSINFFSEKLKNKQFFGFDTFTGLTENWAGTAMPAGTFDLKEVLPKVNKNVDLIKGDIRFEAPKFFDNRKSKISFVHIDCDLYKPAATALFCVKPFLNPGAIILFDDFFNYPGWKEGELKALRENFADHEYEYLCFSKCQAAIRFLGSNTSS